MSSESVSRSAFRSTQWSVVLRAGGEAPVEARVAMEQLIRTYWYPLYAFVRRRGYNDHDAMDIIQSFFLQMLENTSVSGAKPEYGRFRAFLIASIKNYLLNHNRAAQAAKRGGNVALLSIDSEQFEQRYARQLAFECDADRQFDRDWADAVLESAIRQLRQDYAEAGREKLFEAIQPFLIADAERSTINELSSQLRLGVSAIKMSIHRMRKEYARRVREQIATTLASASDIEDELSSLIRLFGSP